MLASSISDPRVGRCRGSRRAAIAKLAYERGERGEHGQALVEDCLATAGG